MVGFMVAVAVVDYGGVDEGADEGESGGGMLLAEMWMKVVGG